MQKRHILRKSSLFTPLTDTVYHSTQLSERATFSVASKHVAAHQVWWAVTDGFTEMAEMLYHSAKKYVLNKKKQNKSEILFKIFYFIFSHDEEHYKTRK